MFSKICSPVRCSAAAGRACYRQEKVCQSNRTRIVENSISNLKISHRHPREPRTEQPCPEHEQRKLAFLILLRCNHFRSNRCSEFPKATPRSGRRTSATIASKKTFNEPSLAKLAGTKSKKMIERHQPLRSKLRQSYRLHGGIGLMSDQVGYHAILYELICHGLDRCR